AIEHPARRGIEGLAVQAGGKWGVRRHDPPERSPSCLAGRHSWTTYVEGVVRLFEQTLGFALAGRQPGPEAPSRALPEATMQIWDRFLTEEDRAILAKGRFGRRMGFGRRSAVLVIDAQRYMVGEA